MVFNEYDSKVQGVKEKHMSPYIESEIPVFYGRKVMYSVKVFFQM